MPPTDPAADLPLFPDLEPDSPIAIEELAAEFIDRCQRGERPSIREYLRDYPALAPAIEDLFPTILQLEGLKELQQSSGGQAVTGLPFLEQLGDFRIVREIGRGGMGVVFLAEQVSLHRRVALKVLGANVARSEAQRQRFKREAEAAARLHHTNIVPVFGIGEEHGVQYYAMQYIDGWPLSEIIEELRHAAALAQGAASEQAEETLVESVTSPEKPARVQVMSRWLGGGRGPQPTTETDSPTAFDPQRPAGPQWRDFQFCARLVSDLADAVSYAHAHGVLHRDLKPANVIVDREGDAWLVDFGLAKQQDYVGLTLTGDTFGTVRYMAPEQCNGRTDERSDIYSLGLTLYELLSLTPAYPETQQAQLISRKTTQDPVALHSLVPGIPRDLETIAMKACAIDPAQRYQTAAEFAEDLRRFVEDRPIRARRETTRERLWRWARRNPTIAGLLGLTTALMLAVIAVIGIGHQRMHGALILVEQQKRRAEGNLEMSVSALEEIMANVSRRGIPRTLRIGLDEGEARLDDVGVSPLDAELLNALLEFYDRFAAQNDADLEAQTAQALAHIGDIETRLGHVDRALDAYQRAIEKYDKLRRESSSHASATSLVPSGLGSTPPPVDGTARWVLAQADTLNQLGIVQAQGGWVLEACRSHDAARLLLEGIIPTEDSDAIKFELAETLLLSSSVGRRAGGREMSHLFRSEVEHEGHRQHHEAGMSQLKARWHGSHGPRMPGLPPHQAIERATTLLLDLNARHPENAGYRLSLAKCLLSHWASATFFAPQEDPESCRELRDRGLAILHELVGEFPESPQYTYELADALCDVSQLTGEINEAELKESLELAERLAANYPRVADYQALLARSVKGMAELADRQNQSASAGSYFTRAVAIQQRLALENRSVLFFQIGWAQILSEYANWLSRQGEEHAAVENLDKAIGLLETSVPHWGHDPLFDRFLRHLHKQRAALL